VLSFPVTEVLEGERLDRALSLLLEEVSRARLAQWIKAGHVRVDSPTGGHIKGAHKGLKPSLKLKREWVIHCEPPPDPTPTLAPQEVPFEVVYHDEDLAVVYKPAGVVVHPGAGQPDQTLVNGLLKRFGKLSPVGHPTRPGVIHRLDRDTSGLLMVALTERAHHPLVEQLAERTVERRYLALAWRPPVERSGVIETPYGRASNHRIKFTGRGGAKRALTRWRILEDFERCALFELKLETGRTHQIRVHLSEMGSPLLADSLYGGRQRVDSSPTLKTLGWELGMKRHALHATSLAFTHPISGERLSFERPLPEDMQGCLDALSAERRALTEALNAQRL